MIEETLPAHSMPGVGKQPEAVRWSEEETSRDSLLLLGLWLRVSTVDVQHPDVVSGQFSQCLLELLVSGDGDDITIRIPVLEVQVFAAFLQCLGEERGNALLELVVSHLSRSDLELAGHFAIGYLEVDHSCCCCSFFSGCEGCQEISATGSAVDCCCLYSLLERSVEVSSLARTLLNSWKVLEDSGVESLIQNVLVSVGMF